MNKVVGLLFVSALAWLPAADELLAAEMVAEKYAARAVQSVKDGKLAEAHADFNKAIELKSDDALLYSGRGFARLKKGDQSGAVGDFTKAIELKPDESSYYEARLYLYDRDGRQR